MHNRIPVLQGKSDTGIQTFSERMDIQAALCDLAIIFFDNCFRQIRKITEIVVKRVSVDPAFQHNILHGDFCKGTLIKYCSALYPPLISKKSSEIKEGIT